MYVTGENGLVFNRSKVLEKGPLQNVLFSNTNKVCPKTQTVSVHYKRMSPVNWAREQDSEVLKMEVDFNV